MFEKVDDILKTTTMGVKKFFIIFNEKNIFCRKKSFV